MLAGIADVYCTQQDDYATYDEALAFAFECVAEHAFKASQEHFCWLQRTIPMAYVEL